MRLDLALVEDQLRFYYGSAILLATQELMPISTLSTMLDGATRRAVRRAEEQARRAERYAMRLRELGIAPITFLKMGCGDQVVALIRAPTLLCQLNRDNVDQPPLPGMSRWLT